MHTAVHTYTFIIYCGNVLNAWINTAPPNTPKRRLQHGEKWVMLSYMLAYTSVLNIKLQES